MPDRRLDLPDPVGLIVQPVDDARSFVDRVGAVRWKIRVVTGAEAARTDARQAEAIRELLTWAQRYTRRSR